jgi:hypothetical protein
MPEAEYVLSPEHTERRFKQRLTLRCFTWPTPQGQGEFCGMLKKLDETLPLAESSGLANADLAGRFYLARRGVLECGDLSPLSSFGTDGAAIPCSSPAVRERTPKR